MRAIEPKTNSKRQQVLICTCCGNEKILKLFPKGRNRCKDCTAEYQRGLYLERESRCKTEAQRLERNKQQAERQQINRIVKKYARKRKRIILAKQYDSNLYAQLNHRHAILQRKLQIECDSLWDKFCSLESLISVEAFRTIERINQIEYLTV